MRSHQGHEANEDPNKVGRVVALTQSACAPRQRSELVALTQSVHIASGEESTLCGRPIVDGLRLALMPLCDEGATCPDCLRKF